MYKRQYYTPAVLTIPRLKKSFAVIDTVLDKPIAEFDNAEEVFDELLKISAVKFWGPNPNQVGNYCIIGHNYTSAYNPSLRHKMFSHVKELEEGDMLELRGLNGEVVRYKIYSYSVVEPNDTKATSQRTNGKRELTLITCTDNVRGRIIIKAREV